MGCTSLPVLSGHADIHSFALGRRTFLAIPPVGRNAHTDVCDGQSARQEARLPHQVPRRGSGVGLNSRPSGLAGSKKSVTGRTLQGRYETLHASA